MVESANLSNTGVGRDLESSTTPNLECTLLHVPESPLPLAESHRQNAFATELISSIPSLRPVSASIRRVGSIRIQQQINRLIHRISIPMHRSINYARIRIRIVIERSRHTRQRSTQVDIELWRAHEWFSVVISQSGDIVEYKCHFFEMGCSVDARDIGCMHVEAVAIG